MVNAQKGVLVECDIPMAQFIIWEDKRRRPSEKFIICKLDDTHLFVQPDAAEGILKRCQKWMDENTYEKPT